MATKQEAKVLEETLNKTDLGQIVNENKKPILIVAGVAIIMIIAYSIVSQVQQAKQQEFLDKTFKVEQSVFTPYLTDKTKAPEFKVAFAGISNEFQANVQLVPTFLTALNKLEDEGALDTPTMKLSMKWLSKMDQSSPLYSMAATRVAGIQEDLGAIDKAIVLLTNVSKSKSSFMSDRVHFQLGRLHMGQGNKVEAKTNFEKVVAFEGESEFKAMAQLYLSEL